MIQPLSLLIGLGLNLPASPTTLLTLGLILPRYLPAGLTPLLSGLT